MSLHSTHDRNTRMTTLDLYDEGNAIHSTHWLRDHVTLEWLSWVEWSHLSGSYWSVTWSPNQWVYTQDQWVMSHMSMDHVTHVNEPLYTYQGFMSHMSMSHVTCTNEPLYTCMSHLTHSNESCHTCPWVLSHVQMSHFTRTWATLLVHEPLYTYQWIMSHISVSHFTSHSIRARCACGS